MTDLLASSSIERHVLGLHEWLTKVNHVGWSINAIPYSTAFGRLPRPWSILGIACRQVFRLTPLNLRRFLPENTRTPNPNATLILARAYLTLWQATGQHEHREVFDKCMQRVLSFRSSCTKHFSAAQQKKLSMLLFQANEQDLSALLTAWAGALFSLAFEATRDDKYLTLADSVRSYFLAEHPQHNEDGCCHFALAQYHWVIAEEK